MRLQIRGEALDPRALSEKKKKKLKLDQQPIASLLLVLWIFFFFKRSRPVYRETGDEFSFSLSLSLFPSRHDRLNEISFQWKIRYIFYSFFQFL